MFSLLDVQQAWTA